MEVFAQPTNCQIMKRLKGVVLQASMVDAALTWSVAASGSHVHSSSPPLWSQDGKVPFPDVPNLTETSTFTHVDFSISASNWPVDIPQNSFPVVASAIMANRNLILGSLWPACALKHLLTLPPLGSLFSPRGIWLRRQLHALLQLLHILGNAEAAGGWKTINR